jgi:diguanylate cyclase (GGDEF)-like protein/PAS domain S-box-containing protein
VRALVAHPDPVRREQVARLLSARGHELSTTAGALPTDGQRPELAVVGWHADVPAPELIRRARRDETVFVVLTDPRARTELEEVLAAGALSLVIEPADDERLWSALVSAEYVAADHRRRQRVLSALRQSAQRFRSLVQNALDIIAVLEPDGTIRYASPAVLRLLDLDPHRLTGSSIYDFVHEDDLEAMEEAVREGAVPGRTSRVEVRLTHASGAWRYFELVADNLVDYPSVRGIVVNGRDVTDRHELEQMLARQAFHDGLTGLANRALFMDRLDHALVQQGRRPGSPGLLFIDLDGFKTINDRYGHEVGDRTLVAVGRRLLELKREGDTAARLGGDEFTLLLESVDGRTGVLGVAERLLEALREPFVVGELSLALTVSIGVALAEPDIAGTELVRRADAAMYRAKELGKNRSVVWEPEHDSVWPRSQPPP